MTNKVKKWDKIEVHYRGTLEDWTQFDSSYDRWDALWFTVWAWQMIAWFDAWVIWMEVWEKKTLKLAPSEAYGEMDETKNQTIRKKVLVSFVNAGYELTVWEKLPTQYWEFEIISSDEENIVLNTNHSLAWKTLIFEVEIVKIK